MFVGIRWLEPIQREGHVAGTQLEACRGVRLSLRSLGPSARFRHSMTLLAALLSLGGLLVLSSGCQQKVQCGRANQRCCKTGTACSASGYSSNGYAQTDSQCSCVRDDTTTTTTNANSFEELARQLAEQRRRQEESAGYVYDAGYLGKACRVSTRVSGGRPCGDAYPDAVCQVISDSDGSKSSGDKVCCIPFGGRPPLKRLSTSSSSSDTADWDYSTAKELCCDGPSAYDESTQMCDRKTTENRVCGVEGKACCTISAEGSSSAVDCPDNALNWYHCSANLCRICGKNGQECCSNGVSSSKTDCEDGLACGSNRRCCAAGDSSCTGAAAANPAANATGGTGTAGSSTLPPFTAAGGCESRVGCANCVDSNSACAWCQAANKCVSFDPATRNVIAGGTYAAQCAYDPNDPKKLAVWKMYCSGSSSGSSSSSDICGNGNCAGGESAASCPFDCGTLPGATGYRAGITVTNCPSGDRGSPMCLGGRQLSQCKPNRSGSGQSFFSAYCDTINNASGGYKCTGGTCVRD